MARRRARPSRRRRSSGASSAAAGSTPEDFSACRLAYEEFAFAEYLGGESDMSDAAKENSGRPVFSPVVAFAMVARRRVGAAVLFRVLRLCARLQRRRGYPHQRLVALRRRFCRARCVFAGAGYSGSASAKGLDDEEYEKASLIILTPGMDNTRRRNSRGHGHRTPAHHPAEMARSARSVARGLGAQCRACSRREDQSSGC